MEYIIINYRGERTSVMRDTDMMYQLIQYYLPYTVSFIIALNGAD